MKALGCLVVVMVVVVVEGGGGEYMYGTSDSFPYSSLADGGDPSPRPQHLFPNRFHPLPYRQPFAFSSLHQPSFHPYVADVYDRVKENTRQHEWNFEDMRRFLRKGSSLWFYLRPRPSQRPQEGEEEVKVTPVDDYDPFYTDYSDGEGMEGDYFEEEQEQADSGNSFIDFPSWDPDTLPDNYSNSSHQVHYVNGRRIDVKHSVDKTKNPSSSSFSRTHVILIRPHQSTKSGGEGEEVSTVAPSGVTEEVVTEEEVKEEPVTQDYFTTMAVEDEEAETEAPYLRPPPVVDPEKEFRRPETNEVTGRHKRGVTASYTKNRRKSKSRKKSTKKDDIPPKDLSKDTDVNYRKLEGEEKLKNPDAEVLKSLL